MFRVAETSYFVQNSELWKMSIPLIIMLLTYNDDNTIEFWPFV